MTRAEIIVGSLDEMGTLSLSEQAPRFAEKIGFIPVVVAEFQRRLPDGDIKTCGALRHLNVACCNTCHTLYPHGMMKLVDLADGSKAWVCHYVEWAVCPERYASLQDWLRNSPTGQMLSDVSCNDNGPVN